MYRVFIFIVVVLLIPLLPLYWYKVYVEDTDRRLVHLVIMWVVTLFIVWVYLNAVGFLLGLLALL